MDLITGKVDGFYENWNLILDFPRFLTSVKLILMCYADVEIVLISHRMITDGAFLYDERKCIEL